MWPSLGTWYWLLVIISCLSSNFDPVSAASRDGPDVTFNNITTSTPQYIYLDASELIKEDLTFRCNDNASLMNVYTQADCESGAANLGLFDTEIANDHDSTNTNDFPIGCYMHTTLGPYGSLYFTDAYVDDESDDIDVRAQFDSICVLREGCTNPDYFEYSPDVQVEDGTCDKLMSFFQRNDGVCPTAEQYLPETGRNITIDRGLWTCQGELLCNCSNSGVGTCLCGEPDSSTFNRDSTNSPWYIDDDGCCGCGCGTCDNLCAEFTTTSTTTLTTTTTTPTTTSSSSSSTSSSSSSSSSTSTSTTPPSPVDCVGQYGGWSACSSDCGIGTQSKTYFVLVAAANNGNDCPFFDGNIEFADCYGDCDTTEPINGRATTSFSLESDGVRPESTTSFLLAVTACLAWYLN